MFVIFQTGVVDLGSALPYTQEEDASRVFIPQESVYIGLESLADETFLSGSTVHYTQAVEVCLIAVALHTLPCDVFAVRRILRIGVVARHFGLTVGSFRILFAKVDEAAFLYIVFIDIRVGRNSICQSRFHTAGESHFIRCGAPRQLLDAAERLHRTFIGKSFKDVFHITDAIAVEFGNERMRSGRYPFIPMFVHQIGNDDAGCLGQIGMLVGGALHGLYLSDEK